MILTAEQLALLRSKPHNTKLYLSVYEPRTVLACQVNDATITKGERIIVYDNVTEGSYTQYRRGMTLYVGTTPGAFDKGTVRVRILTASNEIYVAENSHIDWADDDYLTLVDFFEINAMYPRIIQDPSDPENTLWYKDYETNYTNQNSELGTFICMGSHYAGFLDENGECNIFYTASGTFNLKGDAITYSWNFAGTTGAVTGSTSHTPGLITYNTPGHYTTRLITTTVSGTQDFSYRHISIYDRPGTGDNLPILKWDLEDLSGSVDQGGYSARIKVWEDIPASKLKDGSLVIIFSDDWYGGTKQSIGGNAMGREHIVFVGYVMQGSIAYNYRDSSVSFELGSPSEIMKEAEGFSVSVEHSSDPQVARLNNPNIPSGWVVVLNMDIRRAIFHYFKWHSTVLLTTDFHWIGTDRPLQYFDSDRTSLYDAVNSLLEGAFLGKLVCDRQGALWAGRNIYVEPDLYPTTFELSKQDWLGDVRIDERRMDRTSFIEMGGVAFSGVTGSYTALMTNAPGTAPGYRGSIERVQGLALVSQDELNSLAGNLFAYRNAEYPGITIDLAGNYRNFDIAPQEKIPLSISSLDTNRGVVFTSKNFFIDRIQWTYNAQTEVFKPQITVAELTTGFAGDTLVIPEIPDLEAGGFNIPTISIPQIVIPPFPTFNFGTGGGTRPEFIPATFPYPTVHAHIFGATYDWPGVSCDAGTTTETSTVLYIPFDYAGTLTISHVVVGPSGAGNVYLECSVNGFVTTDDLTWVDGGVLHYSLQAVSVSLAGNVISNINPISINVQPNSFVWIDLIRNGADALDTNASDMILLGWKIIWN